MKFALAAITTLVATASALFDKDQPWGKRDYPCINVYQGVPDNATVAVGQKLTILFNRLPTTHCSSTLSTYPTDGYQLWFYNNPARDNFGNLKFDARVRVASVPTNTSAFSLTVPNNLPNVSDSTLWYLRTDGDLYTAPQMPSIFNAQGPFTILR